MQYIVSIVVGLAICIPVVVGLVRSVRQNVEEKRWDILLKKVISYMITAEEQFEIGAVKKDFVLAMVKRAAEELGLPFDEDKVGAMIDAIVDISKQINVVDKSAVSLNGE